MQKQIAKDVGAGPVYAHKTGKTQKGITLIALVITIIVLLILAGVTISMVLGDDGIIAQAEKAKDAQEKGQGKDEGAISAAEGILSQYSMGKYDDTTKPIAKQNSTINGEKSSAKNPVIPKGFKHLTGTIDEGFVIQDESGNEFVWVPVEEELVKDLAFEWMTGIREPDVLIGDTEYEILGSDLFEENRKAILEDGYENTTDGLKKQFTDEYNAMVKSVEKYGGFYVGRYETSWTGTKVESKATATAEEVMRNNTLLESTWATYWPSKGNKATWYGLYAKQKELYKKNSSSSVVSGMIYGCQWDAIMNWMLKDSNAAGIVTNGSGYGNYTGSSKPTGTAGYDVKNIFDLAGNYWEWTQAAWAYDTRVAVGGDYHPSSSGRGAIAAIDPSPYVTGLYISSRLQLYIK